MQVDSGHDKKNVEQFHKLVEHYKLWKEKSYHASLYNKHDEVRLKYVNKHNGERDLRDKTKPNSFRAERLEKKFIEVNYPNETIF